MAWPPDRNWSISRQRHRKLVHDGCGHIPAVRERSRHALPTRFVPRPPGSSDFNHLLATGTGAQLTESLEEMLRVRLSAGLRKRRPPSSPRRVPPPGPALGRDHSRSPDRALTFLRRDSWPATTSPTEGVPDAGGQHARTFASRSSRATGCRSGLPRCGKAREPYAHGRASCVRFAEMGSLVCIAESWIATRAWRWIRRRDRIGSRHPHILRARRRGDFASPRDCRRRPPGIPGRNAADPPPSTAGTARMP
mgnify:CR=1 FL=1